MSEQHQPGEKVADNIHGVSNGPGESDGRKEIDLTGKDRLVGNVIYSWLAHFVLIVSGFIMPRVIDHQLGQDLLGVWDFAWSLVSYFGLVQAGVGSSVNRYVARYRAASDIAGINRIVSSATFILVLAGLLVLVLTIAVSLLLPSLFGDRLGDNLSDAQWVVFFLGISLVAQIAITAFNGVLTGCHKWGIHNFIKSGGHLAIVIGMIFILLRGGGLPGLVDQRAGQDPLQLQGHHRPGQPLLQPAAPRRHHLLDPPGLRPDEVRALPPRLGAGDAVPVRAHGQRPAHRPLAR